MKPTLLILAAGMGSRYGGLKQLDPVGPNGETIIDYSIFDAMRAGFGKLVFVIRHDMERQFKNIVGARFEKRIAVDYVFQELDKLPPGFSVPASRKKPWGTGHAVLMAADAIDEPFGVVNADDFYGCHSFQLMAEHLRAEPSVHAMVGFLLRNTLSDFGAVSRGICEVTPDGFLKSVTELTKIEKAGACARSTDHGCIRQLTGEETVSMNLWGFTPTIFTHLLEQFSEFLQKTGQDESSEFFIPLAVSQLVSTARGRVKVLRSPDVWFGVTYREDRQRVVVNIRRLIEQGKYPQKIYP